MDAIKKDTLKSYVVMRYPMLVDINSLAGILSCSNAKAREIGANAHSRIKCGKRYMYHMGLIDEYLRNLAE